MNKEEHKEVFPDDLIDFSEQVRPQDERDINVIKDVIEYLSENQIKIADFIYLTTLLLLKISLQRVHTPESDRLGDTCIISLRAIETIIAYDMYTDEE